MTAATRFAHAAAALAACALLPPSAHAAVYKCAGDGGIPVYQEMPCPKGTELRNFQTDPPEITVLPFPHPSATASAAKNPPPRDTPPGNDARPGKPGRFLGDAAERKYVHVGMTEAEVLAKLGSPDVTAGSKSSGTVRWTYLPAPGDPETITALVLTRGAVTDVERKVVKQ